MCARRDIDVPRKRTFTIAVLLSVMLAVSVLPGSMTVSGQDMVTGTATGVRVELDGSWVHVPSVSGDDGDIDTLVFTYRTGNFIINAGTTDVDYVLGTLPAGSKTSDMDVAATYAVRSVKYHDTAYGLFSVVIDDTVQSVIAPADDFAGILRSARANISVNDSKVFFGVDEDLLAGLLPDAENASVPLIRSTIFQSSTPVVVEASSVAEPITGTPTPLATPVVAAPGRNAYVAPWSGMLVNWNDDWQIGVSNGTLLVSSSLEGYQYDEICLEPARQVHGVSVCVSVYQSGAMDNADVWRDHYASPAITSQYGTPYYFVEITDTSVTHAEFDVQGEIAAISQSDVIDGKRVTVKVTASPGNLVDMVELAKLGVHLDGSPVLGSVDIGELRADTDAVIASLPTYQAERDSYLAGLGMVDATHYTSTTMGCDVQWNAPLSLDGLSTTRPVEQGESDKVEPTTANERFALVIPGDSPGTSRITVECIQNLPSIEAWIPWSDATQSLVAARYVTVEGAWAYYLVDDDGALNIILKPLGGPAVVVTIPPGSAGLKETMEALEPGMLVINGVDVFRAFQNDGVAGRLP